MIAPSSVKPGIYAITPEGWAADDILRVAAALLPAGLAIVQLRSKHLGHRQREDLGHRLLALCAEHSVPLIVNDDPALAARLGADGVHLGSEDGSVAQARDHLGPQAWVGVSCYADSGRAQALASAGATYVAFGAVYPTSTKTTPHRASLDLFRAWQRPDVPTVAIGGLNADNAGPVVAAGARWLAVIGGLWNAATPVDELRRMQALFDHHQEQTQP